MSANGRQVWQCCICEERRVWGDGYPEYIELFTLQCGYCHKATQHRFLHVDHQEQPTAIREFARAGKTWPRF